MQTVHFSTANQTHKNQKQVSIDFYDEDFPNFRFLRTKGLLKNIPPQRVKFYVFSICLAGTANKKIGIDNYQFKKNSIYFLHPNQVHSLDGYDESFCGVHIFFQKAFLANTLLDAFYLDKLPFFETGKPGLIDLTDEEMKNTSNYFTKMEQEYLSNNTDKEQVIQAILYLTAVYLKRIYLKKTNQNSKRPKPVYIKYKILIEKYFLEMKTIKEYADLMKISPKTLSRIVLKETGMTALSMIQERLLIEAKILLLNSKYSVAEIAHQLRFTDPAYFSKFFKNKTSKSPSHFRNSYG